MDDEFDNLHEPGPLSGMLAPEMQVDEASQDENYLSDVPVEEAKQKRSLKKVVVPLAAAGVLVAGIGSGAYALNQMQTVTVTINGSDIDARTAMTLEEVVAQANTGVQPGDLIGVDGKVCKEGGGTPFTATVDGLALGKEEAEQFRISGNEEIEVTDGKNVKEETKTVIEKKKPKLIFKGKSYVLSYVEQWGVTGVTKHITGKVSGKTKHVVVTKKKDCIVRSRRPKPKGGKKLVALTFDDGPSTYTKKYLKILKKYKVKATFFNLGQQASYTPKITKKIVKQGHQLCNHTYSHKQLTDLSKKQFRKEITKGSDALKKASGKTTYFIRPPYGEFSKQRWLYSNGLIRASVRWSDDTEDWKLPGVKSIVKAATKHVKPGSIILMHDGGGNRSQDVKALPKIIKKLKKKGYKFVTVSKLMASDPKIPKHATKASAGMPKNATWPTKIKK